MTTDPETTPRGFPHPWRVSADNESEAFDKYGIDPHHLEVTLDGRPAQHIITADEECGLVVQQKYNDAGRPVVAEDRFVTEIQYGRVAIILKPRPDGSWPHFGQPRENANAG